MNFKFRILPFIFSGLIVLVSFHACKKRENGIIDEGYIKYEIEYMEDSLDKFIQNFLPREMVIKFKDNCTRNQIRGLAGIVDFTHIKNYKKKTNVALVTLLDKKYKYSEKFNEPSIFFKQRPDLKINYTEQTKEIAGFNCQKIEITIPSGKEGLKNFDIFFTNEIKVKGFNDHTPFEPIQGVLMEFQLEIYDIPMKFTAKDVKETEISDEIFDIPDGYKRINKKTMKEIIELLK